MPIARQHRSLLVRSEWKDYTGSKDKWELLLTMEVEYTLHGREVWSVNAKSP